MIERKMKWGLTPLLLFCFLWPLQLHGATKAIESYAQLCDQFAPSEEMSCEQNEEKMDCRLIVAALLEENYGAEKVYRFEKEGETILEFSSKERAREVYRRLKNSYDCFLDGYLSSDDILDSCHSWGSLDMGLDAMQTCHMEQSLNSHLTVAVLDTGIDQEHEVFRGRIDTEKSYNFAEGNGNLTDIHAEGHGTHVAGILAEIMPTGSDILCCKIFNENGASSRLIVYTAFQYAIEQGADVINFSASWEDEAEEGFLDGIINQAYQAGIPICVAAGNDADDVGKVYPASLHQAVTVGALDEGRELAEYSNYGDQIDFVAAGTDVESARMGTVSRYRSMTGTSMAVPHIAAQILYIKTIYPAADVDQVMEILKENSQDLGEEGWDPDYGWGMPILSKWYQQKIQDHEGHSYARTVTPASCTEDGEILYQCQDSNCAQSFSKLLKACGHVWKSQAEYSANQKTISLVCAMCGNSQIYESSGVCGDSMAWTASWAYSYSYDEMVCHLELRGLGDMKEYGENQFPWSPFVGKIKSITMDYGITSVADYAFKGSRDLTSSNISLSPNLERIGKEAFANGMRLSSFTLGAKVNEIGDGAFSDCRNLKKFTVTAANSSFVTDSEGILLYSADHKILYACIAKRADDSSLTMEKMTLDSNLQEIRPKAFRGNQNLKNISLPSTMIRLGESAFAACYRLNRVDFGAEVMESIGNHAFEGVQAEAIYHHNNSSWKSMAGSSYGGNLRWKYEGKRDSLSMAQISLENDSYKYEEKAITPAVTVTCQGETLLPDVDYTLSYVDNDRPGQAKVCINGIGYWKGSTETTFQIAKGNLTLALPQEQMEEGFLPVGLGNQTKIMLPDAFGTHARLNYKSSDENVLRVSDSGILTGVTMGQTSVRVFLDNDPYYEDVSLEIPVQVYTGFDRLELEEYVYDYTAREVKPQPKVYNGDQLLLPEEDYTIFYENNQEPGKATLRVTGIGNYRGYLECDYLIRKQTYDMRGITFTGKKFLYDGQEHSLLINGQLPEGVSVTYKGNEEKNAGRYVVTAIFKGDIYHEAIPSLKATMEIDTLDLSSMSAVMKFEEWDSAEKVEYTGHDICPSILIDGLKDYDYDVRYQDNEEPGTATVIVNGIDNYHGQIILHFTIKENELWKKHLEEIREDDSDEEDSDEEDSDEDDSDDADEPEIPLQGIYLTGLSPNVSAGKKLLLTVNPFPAGAEEPDVVWVSSNPKVATVTADGLVSVKKKTGGKKAVITAICKTNPYIRASYLVNSKKGVVKKITLMKGKKKISKKQIDLWPGQSLKIKTKISASKGANKYILFFSSNPYALSVWGQTITARQEGRGQVVIVTAMATDGSGKKSYVKVRIR